MKEQKYSTVSIGEAARLTQTTIKSIRYWSDTGVIECPERVKCGQRSYRQFSEKDLEAIRTIKGLLDQGYTLKTSAIKAKEKFDNGGKIL